MKILRLHRVGLFSTFRFGLAVGLAVHFLPALMFTALLVLGASLLAGWLGSLRATLALPGGFSLPIQVIELLGLGETLQTLQTLASLAAWQSAALGVLVWMLLALLTGGFAVVAAAVFNILAALGGGIEIEVEAGQEAEPAAHAVEPGPPLSPPPL